MGENNENKENFVNTEELKNETVNTVNQVKDIIKNVNIKDETMATKGFVIDLFKNPFGKIKEIAKDNANNFLKTAIFIIIVWSAVALINSITSKIGYWGFRNSFNNLLTVIKSTIAPALEILVLSFIIFMMNKKSKKSLTAVITTITTVYIPVVIAAIVSLLTIISSSAIRITSPFASLCSVITIILSYFAMKEIFEEYDDTKFIKTFVIVEAIYVLVSLVISFLGIYI